MSCLVSCVIIFFFSLFFFFFTQIGGAGRWRICYQRGLPRLVFLLLFMHLVLIILFQNNALILLQQICIFFTF